MKNLLVPQFEKMFKAVSSLEKVYNYDSLIKAELTKLWVAAVIRPEKIADCVKTCLKMIKYKPRYDIVSKTTGVPWFAIALIHQMESDCDFSTHLHNGDSLKARTHQVPAGRPVKGNPPFTWEESAIDALGYDHFTENTDWSIERCLFMFEAYNGFGYRTRGVLSCYNWAGSSVQTKGRYVADGKFDANGWSNRVGCAALLKELIVMGVVVDTMPKPVPPVLNYNVEVINEALKCVGMREKGGNNKGSDVERFQRAVDGKASGEPWCMCFVQFIIKEVEAKFKTASKIKRSEHCLTTWRDSPTSMRLTEPAVGCVVIWQHGSSEKGHTGFIMDVNGDKLTTIEGNTADTNSINRDGDGVYKGNRSRKGDGDMKIVGFLKVF